jgi:F0F1-type ATP synthase membrane subunit b/b'
LIVDRIIQPAILLASEAEKTGFLWNPDIWKVINTLVFVAILVYLLRNKIRIGQVFDNRAATIVKDLEQARRDKQEAEQKLADVEQRLSRLDQEIAEIRAEAERDSAREAERIRQSTEADVEKIRLTAQREVEGAMKAARAELRAFVAEHAVEMAEGLIRRDMKPEDDQRIMARYLDEIGEVKR